MRSGPSNNTNEFIIHVTNEYDYSFKSKHIGDIFNAIKHTWWKITGKNLPIYSVPINLCSLNDLMTSKKMIENGIEK